MSAFSERLTKLVQESHLTKNRLIDVCEINRATFYKYLSGDREPTPEQLDRLIWAHQLKPGEESQLRQFYYIAVIGEEVFRNRQWARRCLETLADLSGKQMPKFHQIKGYTEQLTETTLLQGESQVFHELCQLVQSEMFLPNPRIDLFIPQRQSPFMEYLKALFRNSGEKNVCLRQLVQLSDRKGEKGLESLEFFDSLLYFLATNCMGYQGCYYYSETDFSDAVGVLYPYTVTTSAGVVFLNEAMNRGVFTTNASIHEAARRQFEDAMSKTRQFYTPFEGYREIVEFAVHYWAGSNGGYQYFSTPCFGPLLTREMVERFCPDGMEELFRSYFESFERIREQMKPQISFCSERGLMRFAEDGVMPEYPIDVVPPLTPEERKVLLERMLYDLPPHVSIYLMDETKVPVADEFVFYLSRGERIESYRRELPKLRMFCFREQNLLEAFEDFFSSLPDSELVLPDSELERVLRAAVASCDRQIAERGGTAAETVL